MSIEAREALVQSPNTIFQHDSQRSDLLDPSKTQTQLIALLSELVAKGWNLEFTAIRSDHHDDHALGLHCHANGYCADLWPLASSKAGDYLDAGDSRFRSFLRDCAASQWIHQIGLAGSAYTESNVLACNGLSFQDDGGDHIHCGVQ